MFAPCWIFLYEFYYAAQIHEQQVVGAPFHYGRKGNLSTKLHPVWTLGNETSRLSPYSTLQAILDVSNYEKITVARLVIIFPVLHSTRPFGICIMQAMARLVEALHYKPEGRGFDFRWCNWIFYCHNLSGRTMVLGSNQNISWG
jgi:hypothetical protein